MDDFAPQPRDITAEQVILGTLLTYAVRTADAVTRALVTTDFYDPRHRHIYDAAVGLWESRHPVELSSVSGVLSTAGKLQRVGGLPYLAELGRAAQVPSGVGYWVDIVAECAMRRALIEAAVRVQQRAGTPGGDMTASELALWAQERIAEASVGTGGAVEDPGFSPEDLMAEPPPHQWVIPGLIERSDRLMLTGAEGAGKSTLTRQIAVAAAAGLNPFTLKPTGVRARVLVVDCENGHNLTLRRYRPLLEAAKRDSADGNGATAAKFRLHLEPRGLDLTKRGGQGWLLNRVRAFQPDLVVIGPLYRLQTADPSDEVQARRVAAALDAARDVCGSALIIETHAPHQSGPGKQRNLRPIGSSLWMRWPEFGYGIHPTDEKDDAAGWAVRLMDVKEWRGPRDERQWPKRIRAKGAPAGWSWITDDAQSLGRPF